jgi:hypothetical protein
MPIVKDLMDENQLNLNTSGGESGVVNAGQGVTQDPNASQAEGSSFVNLKKYLDANQGLGAGLGTAVTADSQKNIEGAAGKINDYQAKASQVDRSQANALEGYKTQIATDPTKINASQYKNDTSAAYKGPTNATSAAGYSDAYNAYGSAKDGYENLKSDDWNKRSNAVSSTYGKDNASYTKGMGLLDTFILQGDQGGKDAINSYVNKNANTFAADGKDALSTAKNSVQGAYDAEKGRFDSYLGNNGSLSQSLAAKQGSTIGTIQGRQSQVDAANALNKEKVEVLSALSARNNDLYGGKGVSTYNPGNYTNTIGDYATDQDRAELDALSALSGGSYDKSLVTKSGAVAPSSLVYDKSSGVGKDEYDYDPTTNTLKTRSIYDTGSTPGPTNWTTMNGGTGSGSVGAWLDKLLTEKKYK